MIHAMLDFETLGQKANCAVLSLGAVLFDATGLKEDFYAVPNLKEQCKKRSVDASTITWWMGQGLAAKEVFDQSLNSTLTIAGLCSDFLVWMSNHAKPYKDLTVWSNNAGFDVPIMEHLIDSVGLTPPWNFWNIRCYRTLKALFPIEKDIEKPMVKHHALQDAKFQARAVSAFLRNNGKA